MRATQRKRPLRRVIVAAPEGVDLNELAQRVRYVGSGEHKTYPSFAGEAAPRADATVCDPRFNDPTPLTEWLRMGVHGGQFGGIWEGDFPRYVWFRDPEADVIYEGRLINREQGHYKGYALDPARDTIPAGI